MAGIRDKDLGRDLISFDSLRLLVFRTHWELLVKEKPLFGWGLALPHPTLFLREQRQPTQASCYRLDHRLVVLLGI